MSKTTKSTAEKLARQTAMKCTGSIIDDTKAILATIPLVELLECVEALKLAQAYLQQLDDESPYTDKTISTALTNLDAKLNEKGQI